MLFVLSVIINIRKLETHYKINRRQWALKFNIGVNIHDFIIIVNNGELSK